MTFQSVRTLFTSRDTNYSELSNPSESVRTCSTPFHVNVKHPGIYLQVRALERHERQATLKDRHHSISGYNASICQKSILESNISRHLKIELRNERRVHFCLLRSVSSALADSLALTATAADCPGPGQLRNAVPEAFVPQYHTLQFSRKASVTTRWGATVMFSTGQ